VNAGAKKAIPMTLASAGVVCGMTFALPAVAFASEAEESAGINAILPDMVEFIPMLIAFIVLWIILAKFGWPMFSGMLEKREKTIKDALEKSEEARIESERVLAEYKQQLEEAKLQASQIVAEAKKTGEAVKADMSAKAQQEAADIIAKAKAAIEVEKKAAIAELQSSVADTSINLVARLVGDEFTDDDHRKIVERYVNEAGGFNAN